MTRIADRYSIVGGKPAKSWTYLDDETRVKGFRIYYVYDRVKNEYFYAADFQMLSKSVRAYTMIRLENATTRPQAWRMAKEKLKQTPLPEPRKGVPLSQHN